ncbi:MAG TPA: carboxy terminal-processing peptidase [Pirellulales bacterium]|nr:carboxy terminal-processing peptidase [Pirellulales bacterium]
MLRSLSFIRRRRWIAIPSMLVVLTVIALGAVRAELEPDANDRQVALAVTALLRSEHLTGHPLDNEIVDRTMNLYLKTLDPRKLYFYQSDVDGFRAEALRNDQQGLVSQIRRGDVKLGYKIFKTFLDRLDERMKLAQEFVNADHDFTIDEDIVRDPEKSNYAKDAAEARELWRKNIKFDLLLLKADEIAAKEDAAEQDKDNAVLKEPPVDPKERLTRRYRSVSKQMHQTSHDELLEMFLTSLTTSYDPHSTYMAPSTLENFEIQMRLQLDGIGAQLQWKDGYTVVNKIIPGGAADKDKRLKAEDKVVGVGQGEKGEIVDVVDMKLSDVVQLIRGKRGTVVRLEVIPLGSAERKIYEITRAQIELHDSEARSEILEEQRDGRTYKVGVIDLPSFYMDMEGARRNVPEFKSTTRDVARLLKDFKEKKVDAVIVDLRRNGGGSLTEAINLTGLFIDEGPIVQVKDKDNRKQQYNDLEKGTSWDGPLVVLTSKLSASASEIFAGAIQDYQRGLIVGDKSTHGKGTVQSLLDLGRQLFQMPNAPPLGALKITMQQFYRPNGDSTQNRGVNADIALPWLTNELDIGESDLEYALAFDKIEPVRYDRLNKVDRGTIERLDALSKQRQASSEDFQKVLRNIARYHEQKAKKTVTLNEKKFLAERAQLNADKEQEKEFDHMNDPNRPVFDAKQFYNREVVNITLDYLQQNKLAQR